MGWEPLPEGVTTLAEILAGQGFHTTASVDTPYYLRDGMNYDRGFQSFFTNLGQDTLWSLIPEPGYHHEFLDVRAAWHSEADRNAPKTFMAAMQWLERHYKEDFFLYVDTWDPHEPWDAPSYYTELYMPDYDGELFGKMSSDKYPDGTLRPYDEPGSQWSYSPLYEEIVHLPLLIRAPGVTPGVYDGMSSAIDVMPTALALLGIDIPVFVQGRSLSPAMRDTSFAGRDYVVSSLPFANPGDPVRSVDNFLRDLKEPPFTTVTSGEWSLLYSPDPGVSKLYNLDSDPGQLDDVIEKNIDMAAELHRLLVEFMRNTELPERRLRPRLELRM